MAETPNDKISDGLKLDVKERMVRLNHHAEHCASRADAEYLFSELMRPARKLANIWELDRQLKG